MNAFARASLAAALLLTSAGAQANLTFDTPVSNVTTYQENGFRLTVLAGSASTQTAFGRPSPSLYFGPSFGSSSLSFDITSSGTFTFGGFDLSPNNGDATYSVTGFLGGTSTFTLSGALPGVTGGGFSSVASGTNLTFDRLVFASTSSGSSANFDNILLSATAAVPEPATWAMMIGGFGLVGSAMRRRQKATITFA